MKGRRQDTKSEDNDRKKASFQKLKDENRKLKKKVSQLQKELNKLSATTCLSDWDEDQPLLQETILEPSKVKNPCPKCKTQVIEMDTGLFTVKVCPDCGWKKRYKN